MKVGRMLVGTMAVLMCAGWPARAADQSDQGSKATTESVTVVTKGAGDVRVLTKEVTTTEPVDAARTKTDAKADTAPRKARVVVVPAVYAQEIRSKFDRELSEKFGVTDPGILENPGYTSFLVDALVNSRKLDVLEREALAPVIKELDFGESDYADLARVVKLGRMLNADYVVVPEIRYMFVTSEQKDVPYIGQQQEQVKGKLATSVRVVDVATSKIAASNISSVEDKTRFKESKGPRAQQLRDFVSGLYGQSGVAEAANVIDTAYPIRIVGVSPGQVIINRGKGAIEAGEVLNVYQAGEMMVDPDTKESLGYHEAKIGMVRIVEVNEKTAKAEVVEGDGQIEKLSICRREAQAAPQAVEPPAPKLD